MQLVWIMVGLLNNQRFKARRIFELIEPVIQIFQTDSIADKPLTLQDTVQLYKMLGQFNEIIADSIEVLNGYYH